MASSCPSADTLAAFAVGNLNATDWEAVAGHLAGCTDCERLLEGLDEAGDALIHQLAHLPSVEAAAQAPEGEALIADAGRDLARRLGSGNVCIGRFELQAELGMGSFGYVFRAWDPQQQRQVAIKVQRAGVFATAEDTRRFLAEARSAARLKHPAIVALYESGETAEGVGYLVTEYIEGETLQERLARGPLPPDLAADLAAQLAEALEYAHEHGVVHRDIKPSNILIDDRDRPHLMDFGLAQQTGVDLTMTSEGHVMGTPAYMSPEQARGWSRVVDHRTDIYSLSVVLYEMLTGHRPFTGDRAQLLLALLEEEPTPPRMLRPSLAADVEVICLKAMSKAPGRRYQAAGDFAADLRRFLGNQPIQARPLSPLERTWRWCRRYPLAVSVLAAVLVGSITGLLYLSSLSEYFVRETALESARLETKMIDEAWRFYSEEIEDLDFKTTKVAITEKYRSVHPSLPLPASFAIDLGDRISRRTPGMKIRVYSRYPWPGREGGGPQNQVDEEAIEWLQAHAQANQDPPAEYARFIDEEGQRKLLYYTARHMEESCLACHNHPQGQSPKKDWKLGEVVGVLQIVRPLDREIERTRKGLRGGIAMMAGTAGVLVAVSLLVSFARRRVRR